MTAAQVREVVGRLAAAGHWEDGDPPVIIVMDAGYNVTRLAWLLADLPVAAGRPGAVGPGVLPPGPGPGRRGRPGAAAARPAGPLR